MSEQYVCSVCGEPLGNPSDEIGDDGHFSKVEGRQPDDPRFRCGSTGQITHPESAAVPKSEYDGGTPDEPEPASQAANQKQQNREKGLDLGEDLEPLDILQDVLSNPIYELSNAQINEVISWAEEFDDGMIPPDSLEDILGLLEGISKQKAQLMRQKYELKIQRWMREQSHGDGGPPIGVMGRRRGGQKNNIRISRGRSGQNDAPSRTSNINRNLSQTDQIDDEPERVIDRRRKKAQERVDEFANEFLDSFASNVGDDVGRFYSDIRGVVVTALNEKAKRDPDWVIEKLETLGGFEIINELMDESDAKKREKAAQQSQMSVDAEVERAAASINDNNQQNRQRTNTEQHMQTSQEQINSSQQPKTEESKLAYNNRESDNSMETLIDEQAENETESTQSEGENEMFEETFGQLQESEQ